MGSYQTNERYDRTLIRNLHEIKFAFSKLNAFNKFAGKHYSPEWDFLSIVGHALENDLISHLIKVLDRNKKSSTFWYLYNCQGKIINDFLKKEHIDIKPIETLSNKLKNIRNFTHFHIDKEAVINPNKVWTDEDIRGDLIIQSLNLLWKILNHLHKKRFEVPFPETIYEGEDIPKILEVLKKEGLILTTINEKIEISW